MSGAQMLRPSQFILVYGPGAILEGPRGPRLIPDPIAGLFRNNLRPDDFRIDDDRMSKGILGGKKIYRIPSNAEMGYEPGEHLYSTAPFPRWKMCMNKERHGGAYYLYRDNKHGFLPCPVCRDYRNIPGATRFVQACPDGHMDEVSWHFIVHGNSGCGAGSGPSANDTFLFRSASGPISSIVLECPRCGATANFGEAYNREFRCWGRCPEKEPPHSNSPVRSACSAGSRIIQRQASNLRVPVVETHFTIRPLVTEVHTYMADRMMKQLCRNAKSKEEVLAILAAPYNDGDVQEHVMEEIRRSSLAVLQDAISSALEAKAKDFLEMIGDEFRELVRASEDGAPPQRPPNNERVLFEVERNSTRSMRGPGGKRLRVTPVKRLRTVTVQTGFRRLIETRKSADGGLQPRIDISVDHNGERWYPGVEFLGEGIFVYSPDPIFPGSKGESTGRWSGVDSSGYDPSISQHESFRELDPEFVWWHTLAHALTRTISEHAGYSSASIRERVYAGEQAGGAGGGILLYATQPGNDGTLGGMISLVPFFDALLRASMERVESCSGDPLCGRQTFHGGNLNGASCYGCVMNSETSCEHRNMWLDRHVLLENPP